MKKQNIIPILGIAVVLLYVLTSMVNSRNKLVQSNSVIPPDTTAYSVDQMHLIIKKVLDKTMPEHYNIFIDKEAHTCTIDYWMDDFNTDIINETLTKASLVRKWNENLSVYGGYCSTVKSQFDDSGHPEYDVILNFVNCDSLGQVFATWKNGEVIFDIVEATPPGERVEP